MQSGWRDEGGCNADEMQMEVIPFPDKLLAFWYSLNASTSRGSVHTGRARLQKPKTS